MEVRMIYNDRKSTSVLLEVVFGGNFKDEKVVKKIVDEFKFDDIVGDYRFDFEKVSFEVTGWSAGFVSDGSVFLSVKIELFNSQYDNCSVRKITRIGYFVKDLVRKKIRDFYSEMIKVKKFIDIIRDVEGDSKK